MYMEANWRKVRINYEDLTSGHRWSDGYMMPATEPIAETLTRFKKRMYRQVWKNNIRFDTRKIRIVSIVVTDTEKKGWIDNA